ncbi:hypothetical protein T4B_9559 [Trichinella pseudospiralis]|nr:hypothetical protein T4A_8456 [Trichinella pseudospiralis]KRZ30622.1 hypothetical protein T4B_9559 [Trichinella pseudospiralis]KRZ43872.1 hypothetical protein T4C_10812 [Trichinella pseudospiralis]
MYNSTTTTSTSPSPTSTAAANGGSCDVTSQPDQHLSGMPLLPPLSPFLASFLADLSAKTIYELSTLY